jgi:hypothetical protein
MIEFDQWKRQFVDGSREQEWLILGKGPTYSRRKDFDLRRYKTMSLNHVVTDQPVDVAHMIDFDVAESCAEAIRSNARWLLMPRHPHVAFRPTLLRLEELIRHVPILADLEREGRIVCYDLSNSPEPPSGTQIEVQYFSSEAALDLVGHLGARVVSTLGIDGGTVYADSFSSLDAATRLANGQPSFSVQFLRLEDIARRHALTLKPLVPPLKVFVGVQDRELIAARVLEFTISEHASAPVQVIHLPAVQRSPKDPKKRQRTAFSFSRFLIPELMGYQGRALYLDSDMQVFDDITDLWDVPFDGAKVLCTNQTYIPPQWLNNPQFHPGRQLSVMMLDCERLFWKIDEIVDALDADTLTYEELMFKLSIVPESEIVDGLPPAWNHLEHFVEGETKLIHYTAIPTQPWKSEDNPNRGLWEAAFVRACEAGYVNRGLVERHVKAGHVRSSLLPLVPPAHRPQPRLDSAMAAELEATRNALALRGGPLARAAGRIALARMRQAPGWAAPFFSGARRPSGR